MAKKKKGMGGVSGVGRASYPFLYRPQKSKKGDKEHYTITLIFDPDVPEQKEAMESLKKVADEVGKDEFGSDWDNDDSMKHPVKFGNPKLSKTPPEYKGKYTVAFKQNASVGTPQIVDTHGNNVDSKDMYAGCYCRVSFFAKAYNVDGGRGVTFYLNNVLKVSDGEPIGGSRKAASEDFNEFFSESVSEEQDPLFS